MTRRASAVVAAFALLTLVGCAEQGVVDDASVAYSERYDFNRAAKAGTSAAWQQFLYKYPQSSSRDKAKASYDEAVWKETQLQNTARAYLDFLDGNPDSSHAADARAVAGRLLTEGVGSEQDFTDFLRTNPDAPEARSLRQALMKVRYNTARTGTSADAALFVAQYPGTREAGELLPQVQEKEFSDAESNGTRLAYEFYAKRYPGSSYAAKASSRASGMPRSEAGGDAEGALRLLPKLRAASPDLRAQECRVAMAAAVKKAGDLYGAEAERARGRLRGAYRNNDTEGCAGKTAVPERSRAVVGSAVRALAELSRRQARLANAFAASEGLSSKAAEIADSAARLADESESFELELEAYFGSMPADPEHPEEKASNHAKEGERLARKAADAGQDSAFAERKSAAGEVLRKMDEQMALLTRVIAYYETPQGAAE